jgi:hypothetical protein
MEDTAAAFEANARHPDPAFEPNKLSLLLGKLRLEKHLLLLDGGDSKTIADQSLLQVCTFPP